MSTRQGILISLALIGLFALGLWMSFGDSGAADLYFLKQQRDRLLSANEVLVRGNLDLHRIIDRLKREDPVLIESVARQELGMIAKDELIIKLGPPEDASGN